MIGLNDKPLNALSGDARNLLSERLNPRRVLPILGPDELARHRSSGEKGVVFGRGLVPDYNNTICITRDWRGVASLVPISTEVADNINQSPDKMCKVLDIWISRNDGTANIGRLLDILQLLDRYDVCEDLMELARENRLLRQENNNNNQLMLAIDDSDENIITYDDKLYGTPQRYHAYVLYARQDKTFVDELLTRMRSEGFKLCTEEDLLPGHMTQFEPVSRLIAERCRYIVLVYSPDFVRSPAIAFYMNLAQADSINKQQSKLIPVMYRECSLPKNLIYYHNLRYPQLQNGVPAPYNFWERLSRSLRIVDRTSTESTQQHSKMKIVEETNSQSVSNGYQVRRVNGFSSQLALPEIPTESSSLIDLRSSTLDTLDTLDIPLRSFETQSLSSAKSHTIDAKKKKYGAFRKLINSFRGKKHKIAVEN